MCPRRRLCRACQYPRLLKLRLSDVGRRRAEPEAEVAPSSPRSGPAEVLTQVVEPEPEPEVVEPEATANEVEPTEDVPDLA